MRFHGVYSQKRFLLRVFQRDACSWKFQFRLVLRLQAFAKEGAQVTATDINGEKLEELSGVPGLMFVDLCLRLLGEIKAELSHLRGCFRLKTQGRE